MPASCASQLPKWCLLVLAFSLFGRPASGLPEGTVLHKSLSGPMGLYFAPDGELILTDTDADRVLKCPNYREDMDTTPLGQCVVIAGTGAPGYQADMLRTPYVAIPAKASGSDFGLYVADTHNHRIQYFAAGSDTGVTVVGGPGVGAPNFDEASQELNFPAGLALDEVKRYLYVADTGRHRIVRYELNSQGTGTIGFGKTVAGTIDVPGTNLTQLDNPTSLCLDPDTDRLWVSDARNGRIMRWLVNDALLLAEDTAAAAASGGRRLQTDRRLEADDNSSNTSNITSTTATITTATETRTITTTETATTTTTTYSGPRMAIEFSQLKGRSYGIFFIAESLYIVDSDGCKVWKKVAEDAVAIAAGSCGARNNQLLFPANLVVDAIGAITVADSSNDRVIRFDPHPTATSTRCYLGGKCEILLQSGNPTATSLMAVVKRDTGSSCGGRCLDSGLGGAAWTNAQTVTPPFLKDMNIDLGISSYGDVMTNYLLCYGVQGVAEEVLKENCTSTPYTAGTLLILPFLQADETSLQTECVTGGECTIYLSGYGIPDNIYVFAPVDSAPDTGFSCGDGSGQNFQGQNTFVSKNPGTLMEIVQPFINNGGNLTATAEISFGPVAGLGSQLLCVCYEGNACNNPKKFTESAGYLRVRSATPGQMFYCILGGGCKLTVFGRFLKQTDVAAIVHRKTDCTSLVFADVAGQPFTNPLATAESTTASSVYVEDGNNTAVYDFGTASEEGVYKVCYCASYNSVAAGATGLICDEAVEFTQEAGTISVVQIAEADFECPMYRNCSVTVNGQAISDTDQLLVTTGAEAALCGSTAPVPAQVVAGIYFAPNYFGANGTGNSTMELFELGSFYEPGERQACYCTSYDQDPTAKLGAVVGPCNDAGEFYQPVGVLSIRGPEFSELFCPANMPCTATIPGFKLSSNDALQVCPIAAGDVTQPSTGQASCGDPVACAPAGANAKSGLVSPTSAKAGEAIFELGSLQSGTYALCYCASGTGSSAINCSSPQDTFMYAGTMKARGVAVDQLWKCLVGFECAISVAGFQLSETDAIIAIPLSGTCGQTAMITELNVFNPSAQTQAEAGGTTESQPFSFQSITVPDRYKICYCVLEECLAPEDFFEEAGVLVVKGLITSRWPAACQLGETCKLQISGSGLEYGTDAVQLLPRSFDCGGYEFRVTGGTNETGTGQMNGTYTLGNDVFDGRRWFQHQTRVGVIFFDVFIGRWIIGPDREPEVPSEVGWAYAVGEEYTGPDQVPQGEWQIWNPDAGKYGRWENHPTLTVLRAIDPNVSFSRNPSHLTTNHTVDADLGLPFLFKEEFDLGVTVSAGTYRICWCPSWDKQVEPRIEGGDSDTIPCSSDQEFMMSNGALLVGHITVQGFHHCILGAKDCIVQLALTANIPSRRAVLLPLGTECYQADVSMPSPWGQSRNVSGLVKTNDQAVFDFGKSLVVGQFEICICAGYDDGEDERPCSKYSEFYEQGGTVTVADIVDILISEGDTAVFNLTRGSGLRATDRMIFVPGESCSGMRPSSLADVMAPSQIDANGGWSTFKLGPGTASGDLSSGSYTACFCASFDDGDVDEDACSNVKEFFLPVGRVKVSTLQPPTVTSTVSSSLRLRLNLTRRLSSGSMVAAASLTYMLSNAVDTLLETSLEGVLGASPVDVEIEGITPLIGSSGDGFDVQVNFTASLRRSPESQLLEAREVDNLTCPTDVLVPPWLIADRQAQKEIMEDTDLILGCLELAQVLGEDEDRSIDLANKVALGLNSISLSGILQPITVLGFDEPKVGKVDFLTEEFGCARGADCSIYIEPAATSTLPAIGSLLIVQGLGPRGDFQRCGTWTRRANSQGAASRAVTTFGATLPVDATAATPTSSRTVNVGVAGRVGTYIMCYCPGEDTGHGKGACKLDRDYFNLVGNLEVRGVLPNSHAYCVVHQNCKVEALGTGLSIWDSVLVKDGDSCTPPASGFDASAEFDINPSALPQVGDYGDHNFDFGVAKTTGVYTMCYCASYSASPTGTAPPCQNPADFTMEMGKLYVRGVQLSTFRYGCVKAVRGDAPAPCSLYVTGMGLMPEQDKVLLTPAVENVSCGEVETSREFGVIPNPIAFELPEGDPVVTWGSVQASVAAKWTIDRAEVPGEFRVCYCADSADGASRGMGKCQRGADGFYHEVGYLRVRGAEGAQLFACYPGGNCTLTIYGVSLSEKDKVRLVGAKESCEYPDSSANFAEFDMADAFDVNETGSMARFNLGIISDIERYGITEARVCYCANYNADYEGLPCTNSSDFTHSAGRLNIATCPEAPEAEIFIPPVEDVLGDPGDAKLRLYAVPAWLCLDLNARTENDLAEWTVEVPLGDGGFEGKGGMEFPEAMVLVTSIGRCTPYIIGEVPRINSLNTSYIDFSIVGGLVNNNSVDVLVANDGLRMVGGFSVRGKSRLIDNADPPFAHSCDAFQVEIVPIACGWDATVLFGAILHLFMLLIAVFTCVCWKFFDVFKYARLLKRVDPVIPDAEEEMEAAEEEAAAKAKKEMEVAEGIKVVQPAAAVDGEEVTVDTRNFPFMNSAEDPYMTEKEDPLAHKTQTLSVKALGGGGSQGDPRMEAALAELCSRRLAVLLAMFRMVAFFIHMLALSNNSQDNDHVTLFVMPIFMTVLSLTVQVLLLQFWLGRDHVKKAMRRPQYWVHSFTLNYKIHLDIALPTLLIRHHCELWRPAMMLVVGQIFFHVLMPVGRLLLSLLPKRRDVGYKGCIFADQLLAMEAPEVPGQLEAIEMEETEELRNQIMQDPYFYQRFKSSHRNTRHSTSRQSTMSTGRLTIQSGSDTHRSTTSGSTAGGFAPDHSVRPGGKVPHGVKAADGSISLASLAGDRVALSKGKRLKPMLGQEPKRLAGGLEIAESTGRTAHRANPEAVAAQQKEREESLQHILRMQGLETMMKSHSRAMTYAHVKRYANALVEPVFWCSRIFFELQWTAATYMSLMEDENPEELRRHRMISLWTFFDNSGWYVCSTAFRKQVECAAGFNVPRAEARHALIGMMVGGLDLAVMGLFLAFIYAPRLTYNESVALAVAALMTIFQTGRPGIMTAATAMLDDYLDRPFSVAFWLCAAVAFRCFSLLPVSLGCVRYSWGGYLAMTPTILYIELPLAVLCWRFWPLISEILRGEKNIWEVDFRHIISESTPKWATDLKEVIEFYARYIFKIKTAKRGKGKVVAWAPPKKETKITTPVEAPSVPPGSRAPGPMGHLASKVVVPKADLRIAAKVVEALRKQEGDVEDAELTFPAAEPCLQSFFQLVEELGYSLPEEIAVKLIYNPRSQVARLHGIFSELHSQPPLKNGVKRRQNRLRKAVELLGSLAECVQYMDEWPRETFTALRRTTHEELFRAELTVSVDRLIRSAHFRNGTLRSRAEVAAAALPTAPRIWLVHYDNLLSLGRLPRQDEYNHLTLATRAHEVYGPRAVMITVVSRWRGPDAPDPHSVTWRQLITFARWYRWRWGEELEIYFWIDYCCMTEQQAIPVPNKARPKKETWDDDDEIVHDGFAQRTTTTGTTSSKSKSLAEAMAERGLTGLQAWAEEEEQRQTTTEEVEEEELEYVPSIPPITTGRTMPPRKESFDTFLPVVFAASDAVLLCRDHQSDDDLWTRTYLSMAFAFCVTGRLIYEVDRNLVHVTKKQRREWKKERARREEEAHAALEAAAVASLGFLPSHLSFDSEALADGLPYRAPRGTLNLEDMALGDFMASGVAAPRNSLSIADADDSAFMTQEPSLPELTMLDPTVMMAPDGGIFETTAYPQPSTELSLVETSTELGPSASLIRPATVTEDSVFANADVGSTFGGDAAFQEFALDQFLKVMQVKYREEDLLDPTKFAEVVVHKESFLARVKRLKSWAMDAPVMLTDGDYPRQKLLYDGTRKLLVCSLEGPRRAKPKKVRASNEEDESSSDSEDDEEEPWTLEKMAQKEEVDEEPPMLTVKHEATDWNDKMLEFYYGKTEEQKAAEDNQKSKAQKLFGLAPPATVGVAASGKRELVPREVRMIDIYAEGDPLRAAGASSSPKRRAMASDDLLKRAADARLGSTTQSFFTASSSTRSLKPMRFKKEEMVGDPILYKFHPTFYSKGLVLGDNLMSARQFRPEDTFLPAMETGSGGMAVTKEPLEYRSGVAPDSPDSIGITFDATIEETTSGVRDGLGIGFTAADPDKWPLHRKAVPKGAIQLPRTCVVGYSGAWYQEGRSLLNKGSWEPGRLVRGDVLTAVLAGPPANIMRILVNGKVVAQRPATDCGLPEPGKEPMFGIIDVEGTCVKVRLGNRIPLTHDEMHDPSKVGMLAGMKFFASGSIINAEHAD